MVDEKLKGVKDIPTTFILRDPGRPREVCFCKETACKPCFTSDDELAAVLESAKLLSPKNTN